jgi:hypothetical protein
MNQTQSTSGKSLKRWYKINSDKFTRITKKVFKVFVNNMKIWKWILNDGGNKFHWTWNLFNRTTVGKSTDSNFSTCRYNRFWFLGIFTCEIRFLGFFEMMKYKWIHINFNSSLRVLFKSRVCEKELFLFYMLSR